jgi:hypothetical protein
VAQALAARTHAWVARLWWAVRTERRGQGTVEYVGMVVMVTLLIAAVALAAKGWAPDIGDALKKALGTAIKKLVEPFT